MLLAAREDGYRSLMRLNSRAFLETPPNEPPHLKLAWLEGETDGLIALTGGPGGPLDAAIVAGQGATRERRAARRWRGCSATGSMSSCSATASTAERSAEPALVDLAYARGIPLVATNEPFFARREDYEAHDALICIAEGRLVAETDRRQLTPEHRFKTRAEMAALFADLPEALASTVEIAQRCAFRPRDAGADPAALLGRRGRRGGRRGGGAAPAAPRRGSSAGSPRTGSRPAAPSRTTASGSTSSSASSSG